MYFFKTEEEEEEEEDGERERELSSFCLAPARKFFRLL